MGIINHFFFYWGGTTLWGMGVAGMILVMGWIIPPRSEAPGDMTWLLRFRCSAALPCGFFGYVKVKWKRNA